MNLGLKGENEGLDGCCRLLQHKRPSAQELRYSGSPSGLVMDMCWQSAETQPDTKQQVAT